jgi:phage terminase Nu1 subunit (DNA packaging protein)
MAQQNGLTTTQVSKLLMVSPQSIQNLVKAGMPKHGHGKSAHYFWQEVFPWYKARLQDAAIKSSAKSKLDYAYEQALKTKVERERHELKLAKERNEVVLIKDVRHAAEHVFGNVRARLLALPSKLAPKLGRATTPAERQEMVRVEVYDALTELSLHCTDGLTFPDDTSPASPPATGEPVPGANAER